MPATRNSSHDAEPSARIILDLLGSAEAAQAGK